MGITTLKYLTYICFIVGVFLFIYLMKKDLDIKSVITILSISISFIMIMTLVDRVIISTVFPNIVLTILDRILIIFIFLFSGSFYNYLKNKTM